MIRFKDSLIFSKLTNSRFIVFLIASSLVSLTVFSKDKTSALNSFYDLSAQDLQGQKVPFSRFQNKVVLIVNTASQCGFTPQLKDLEDLNKKYSSQDLVILGFPSNDFKQEKSEASEIQKFAEKEYGITFTLMEKGPVSGPEKQPVFKFLTDQKSGILFKEVAWNFEKFLIDRQGHVIDRWSSMTKPSSAEIVSKIEKALKETSPGSVKK